MMSSLKLYFVIKVLQMKIQCIFFHFIWDQMPTQYKLYVIYTLISTLNKKQYTYTVYWVEQVFSELIKNLIHTQFIL